MAYDKVSIWRNAPSPEIALDNELFIEAQESSFLQKDVLIETTMFAKMEIVLTRPSIIVGSIRVSDPCVLRFTCGAIPIPLYICGYSGYDASLSEFVTTAPITTVNVTSGQVLIFCKASPAANVASRKMTLDVSSSATNARLLAGSYLKIL